MTFISQQIDSRRTDFKKVDSRDVESPVAAFPVAESLLIDSAVADSQSGDAVSPDVNSPATVSQPGDGRRLLILTAIAGAASCALKLGAQLGFPAEAVATRREGLVALRAHRYTALVIDDAIAESDPAGVEMLRKYAGAAAVVEVNFVLSSVARVAREVRWELLRRKQEQGLAMRAAYAAVETELRATVTGLLLHSQLALGEPGVTPQLSTKLQMVAQLAADLGKQLERSSRVTTRA